MLIFFLIMRMRPHVVTALHQAVAVERRMHRRDRRTINIRIEPWARHM